MRTVVMVVALMACGRLGFQDVDTQPCMACDANAPVTTGCWTAWRERNVTIGDIRMLDELATPEPEQNPFITADGLTLYFNRPGGSGRDILVTSRPARDARFGPVSSVDELNSSNADDARWSMTDDGLFGVLTSGRGGNLDLWSATRGDRLSPFSVPEQTFTAGVSDVVVSDSDPELSADGLRLYWAKVWTSDQQLVIADRASASVAFSGTRLVLGLETELDTSDPSLSPDELVIVYTQGNGAGISDLYFATRTTVDEAFVPAGVIGGVNAQDPGVDDRDGSVSNDGCEVFFRSDRTGSVELFVGTVAVPRG